MQLEPTEIIARLVTAAVAGAVLGVNRNLHRKPAGLRTHALVTLGSAMMVIAVRSATDAGSDALSRVLQGVVTGIGFVGAGVIMHYDAEHRVEGLTTAASVWVAATLGVACALAEWLLVGVGLFLALLVLVLGGPLEHALERLLRDDEAQPK